MAALSTIWFRQNGGNWNGNPAADPDTGTGGFALGSLAPPYFAAVGQATGFFGGDPFTINLGGSGFAETAPVTSVPWGAAQTFNPADKGTGVTLSNGNLTMTVGGEIEQGVRSTGSNTESTGVLYYFEGTFPAASGDPIAIGFGIANGSTSMQSIGEDVEWAFPGWATISLSGAIQVNGVVQTQLSGFNPGDTWCCAVFIEEAGAEPIVDVADLWFSNTPGFVDLTQEANRRLFIDVNGCPEYLGVNGQLPFNQAPAVFLTCLGGVPASFATNVGLGGTFSITGGDLALASKSPCCSTDVTEQTIPQGAQPQVILSVSDDGGRTWSLLRKARNIGAIGQYLTRLRWLKMGQFRQRIIRLEITDPVKRRIVGFYADVREGLE